MKRTLLSSAALLSLCLFCHCHKPSNADTVLANPHRSPIDVIVFNDGASALTANHTANTISLVDLATGQVIQETPAGERPAGLALSPDGTRVAVSSYLGHSVTLFDLKAMRLMKDREYFVGALPRGIAFSKDGRRLFVALSGADEVVAVDVATAKIAQRWPAPREPRHLRVSDDGQWLVASSSRSSQVRCWEIATGKLHWERTVEGALNLREIRFAPGGFQVVVAHAVRRDLPIMRAHIEEGWIIDSRLSQLPRAADAATPTLQLALDVRSLAMGDPHGLDFSPDGSTVAVTGSGSQEVVLLQTSKLPWSTDPGDTIDGRLLDGKRFRRVKLGGRPLAAVFTPRGDQVVVANYLADSLQIVDVRDAKLVRSIPLGGPKQVSVARKGEMLFHDASRSHNQWFSCHSCHPDGHTSGMNFDTLNDDSFGSPKLAPTLRNVAKTGPWTWHGQQKSLHRAVERSFTETMFGPAPTKDDVAAVVTFLESLSHPRLPTRDDPAIKRGAVVFSAKARCDRCHQPPLYTSPVVVDVKLDAGSSPFEGFNPPSLLGLSQRGPYLHDGRAKTLEEVLRTFHTPRHVGGPALTNEEETDLLAFLRGL